LEDQELVSGGPIFILGADPDPVGCLPPHPGHIQVLEQSDVFWDPGEGFHPVEADLSCSERVPQIGTIRCPPHGPHQGLGSMGMDVEPGRDPLGEAATTIGSRHLPAIQLFEIEKLFGGEPADLGLPGEHSLLQRIDRKQTSFHVPNIRSGGTKTSGLI